MNMIILIILHSYFMNFNKEYKFIYKFYYILIIQNNLDNPISIDEKFYYVDSEFGEISFDAEKAKQLAEEKNKLPEIILILKK